MIVVSSWRSTPPAHAPTDALISEAIRSSGYRLYRMSSSVSRRSPNSSPARVSVTTET
jgi:hypothetical protein